MTEATAISCPNCGACLAPPNPGEDRLRCTFCGHFSTPPRARGDSAQRAAALAELLSMFETNRSRAQTARGEVQKRAYEAAMAARRTNGWVLLGVGGLFLVFALVCFVGAASQALGARHDPPGKGKHHSVHVSAANRWDAAGPPFVFGLFWLVFGGGMFYGGVRYGRAAARDRRLRATGLRGRGLVRSYKESSLEVDGNTRFELVLEVELPEREPYLVKQGDYVPHPWAVRDGADLPVFVDPRNPNDVMVDWFTLQTG